MSSSWFTQRHPNCTHAILKNDFHNIKTTASFICVIHQQTFTHFLYRPMNAKYEMHEIRQFTLSFRCKYLQFITLCVLVLYCCIVVIGCYLILFISFGFSAAIMHPSQRKLHSISVKTRNIHLFAICVMNAINMCSFGTCGKYLKKRKEHRIDNVLC